MLLELTFRFFTEDLHRGPGGTIVSAPALPRSSHHASCLPSAAYAALPSPAQALGATGSKAASQAPGET